MQHIKSSFFFKSKEDNWRVDYQDKSDENGWQQLTRQVYLNDELYHDFNKMPKHIIQPNLKQKKLYLQLKGLIK
jgi:hypothetical protein